MPGQLLFNYLGLNELHFAGQDIWLDHKVFGLQGGWKHRFFAAFKIKRLSHYRML